MRYRFMLFPFLFFVSCLYSQNFDINTLRSINVHRNMNLDPAFKQITNSYAVISIGTPLTLYALGLVTGKSELKKEAIYIGESVAATLFATIALKEIIKKERPFVTYPDIQKVTAASGYTFPSGHTSIAFATATSLSLSYPKWYIIAPSFAWASAVGYSRMHLGVHYPTDVFAGALLGSGSAYLTYKINKWVDKREKKAKLNSDF
ncbi:MAG: phosphatase PAP2 family protein [Flavobacterium sp.]